MKLKKYLYESVMVKVKDISNNEIKRVVKELKKVKSKNNIILSISNNENILNITITDKDYTPAGRGVSFVGITKQDHEENIKIIKKTTDDVYSLLKKSKIKFEDLWNENGSVGGILEDYYI